jgi:hypothetical protein
LALVWLPAEHVRMALGDQLCGEEGVHRVLDSTMTPDKASV